MIKGVAQAGVLTFSAGPAAYREIREEGFRPERIGTLAGASGGAKWLVLSQIDRVIASRILPALCGPVHTIGTSIGAWRLACYGQADPLAAIDRFESAYVEQTFGERPDRVDIARVTAEILDALLGPTGAAEILSHPVLRTHVMTVRSRHLTGSERRGALAAGLFAAASLNVVHRRTLGLFFDRVLFLDRRCADSDRPPFYAATGFPLHRVPLVEANFRDAIIATGAIPWLMNGVRDIAGAPPGMYRDGGVIDYHIDLPQSDNERLSLFPHFYNFLKPGWFDKRLSWRRPRPLNVDRMILLSPSPAFVARLPNAKIPDRRDFIAYSAAERITAWRTVLDRCRELADDFEEVLANNRLAERLKPF
jgi:hypothetical protein